MRDLSLSTGLSTGVLIPYPQRYPQPPLGTPGCRPLPSPVQSVRGATLLVIERRARNSRSSELHVGHRIRQRRATIRG